MVSPGDASAGSFELPFGLGTLPFSGSGAGAHHALGTDHGLCGMGDGPLHEGHRTACEGLAGSPDGALVGMALKGRSLLALAVAISAALVLGVVLQLSDESSKPPANPAAP